MSSQTVRDVFASLCTRVNTPRALTLEILSRYGEDRQLVELPFDFKAYLEGDFHKFRDDYLLTEYLSKYKGWETGIDTEEVALLSFKTAEQQCEQTNRRILNWLDGFEQPSLFIQRVISLAQGKIEACIGVRPKLDKLFTKSRLGKGATASLKGEEVTVADKLLEEQISVTPDCLPFARAVIGADIHWVQARGIPAAGPCTLLDAEFKQVPGSRGLTVPKNAKTDRFIAAEPSGNIFLQLAIGDVIRKSLRRVGIDLDDQTVNQVLAERALSLGLATYDMKAASDTIAFQAVWLLLPYEWASLLTMLRSERCYVNGSWWELQKFSSMGNGYTFELESLIFWALTEATRDVVGEVGRVSVYGDDVIAPSSLHARLAEVYAFCGFTLNEKKSHAHGLFRESCGKHYFEGRDVTPIYQKDTIRCKADFYRFHNRLLYHAIDRGFHRNGVAVADKLMRHAVKRAREDEELFRGRIHKIPIMSAKTRSLDGGLVTTAAALEFANAGTILTHKWVPSQSSDLTGCAYAVHLRARQQAKLGCEPSEVIADLITPRRQGYWATYHVRYHEMSDLHWA